MLTNKLMWLLPQERSREASYRTDFGKSSYRAWADVTECKKRYNPSPMHDWAIALFAPHTLQIGMRLMWKSGKKNVKLSLYTEWRQTGGEVVSLHSYLSLAIYVSGRSATRPARFTLGQINLLCPLNGWLGGPESRYDCLGEHEHCLPLPEIELRFLGHALRILVTTSSILPKKRLLLLLLLYRSIFVSL